MLSYVRPARLTTLPCGHPGTAGQLCQHRSHVHNLTPSGVVTVPAWVRPDPTEGCPTCALDPRHSATVHLRRGESVNLTTGAVTR